MGIVPAVVPICIDELSCVSEALLVIDRSVIIETQNIPYPIILEFEATQWHHAFVVLLAHCPAQVEDPGLKVFEFPGFARRRSFAEGVGDQGVADAEVFRGYINQL